MIFPFRDELSQEYRTYVQKNHQNQDEECAVGVTRLHFSDHTDPTKLETEVPLHARNRVLYSTGASEEELC